MKIARNDVRRRVCLVTRRAIGTWPTSRFNHGYIPLGEIADWGVSYWTEQETHYTYHNSDTPWLQRHGSITHSGDFWEQAIDPLNTPDRLLYGHHQRRSSYDTDGWRILPRDSFIQTVRTRPRDFV